MRISRLFDRTTSNRLTAPRDVQALGICPRIGPLYSLIVALGVAASPALALDSAYVGIWAPSPDVCKDGGRQAFRVTPRRAEGREWGCDIKKASKDGDGVRLQMSCAEEGTDSAEVYHWLLLPDGRLKETIKGKTSIYIRCKGKDYGPSD